MANSDILFITITIRYSKALVFSASENAPQLPPPNFRVYKYNQNDFSYPMNSESFRRFEYLVKANLLEFSHVKLYSNRVVLFYNAIRR